MEDEVKDTLIDGTKEEEIKFTLSFKWILGISIGLTGILTFAGIIYLIYGIYYKVWEKVGINDFLLESLFYMSVILCFASLLSIAVIKKPFSKILVWCTMAVGVLFVASSLIFPHIRGYKPSSLELLSNGDFYIDGTLLMIGLLGILFSKVIKYGFMYQTNTDMTV
jgi:hypothetical protein